MVVPPRRVLAHCTSEHCHPSSQRKVQTKRHAACEFAGSLPGLQPSVLAGDRVCLGRTQLRATKGSMSQCQRPHGSAAGTPHAPPCLPALALPPSLPRGCVPGTALPRSGCGLAWVMPGPRGFSMPPVQVLPTWGVVVWECHSGCRHLCFLLCWAQPWLVSNLQANAWLANNTVALWPCSCHTDTGVQLHGTVYQHGL